MTVKRKTPTIKDTFSKKPKRQSDLLAGFAAQVLRSPKKEHKFSQPPRLDDLLELDDAIEISDDEEGDSRARKIAKHAYELPESKEERLELSQLAAGPRDRTVQSAATQTDGDITSIPWIERISLRKVADLAVNKKKVADVQGWIEGAFKNVSLKTVLLLTGPAGVGKTATIETLSHVLDFDVIEWQNPMSTEWSIDRDADSLAQKFERFLSISDKYSALDFGDGIESDSRRKVIVVEDIPNTFSSSSNVSSARLAFQKSIKRYLTSPRGKYPLVLIITETEPRGEDGNWNRFDAMNMRNLLTRDILDASNCAHIPFNDVAPTFISKALARLVDALPRSEALDISQAVLDEIAQSANGDIRSAINSLQFISHRFSTHGKAPRPRKRRRRAEVLTLTTEESQILNMITNRESALGYFHAVGKVIYNKRVPDTLDTIKFEPLPAHLSHEERRRPESSVDMILDETSTDVGTFLMGIHQNYIPSTTTCDEAGAVMDALSKSDLLKGVRESGNVGVMGTLHALPQNARRERLAKVYFPAFKSLMKRESEVRDALLAYDSGSRVSIELIECVSYHSLILQSRGGDGYTRAVSFDRSSHLGRGGIESALGLVSDGERRHARDRKREKLVPDEEDLSDEIEEVS